MRFRDWFWRDYDRDTREQAALQATIDAAVTVKVDEATKRARPADMVRATMAGEQHVQPTYRTAEAQLELYQRLSWVQIAVGQTCQVAATTALAIKRRAADELKDVPNHPLEVLLHRPNPDQSRFEFLMATAGAIRLSGNGYWWLNRSSQNVLPSELWLLPTNTIMPIPDGRMSVRGYAYEPTPGVKLILEPWEVVHFKQYHPTSRYLGLSPIEALATVAVGDLKMQQWLTNFFGKDNAKLAGILAFKQAVEAHEWELIKQDVNEKYGGTARSGPMLLRGVGDQVNWLQTGISQDDMQFLESRTFTKEEIFALYAPGLASMLAVNATEANSVAGRATFRELAVFPLLTLMAQKLTTLLGENEIAEFEDVRQSDQQLELSQQETYAKTHTIDEIRAEYYGDDPLGDERGKLLPAEVGMGMTDARDPEDKAAQALEIAQAAQPSVPEQAPGDDTPPRESPGERAAREADSSPVERDLAKWEAKAIKRLKAGRKPACEFESDAIDAATETRIKSRLDQATSADDVRQAFKADADDELLDDDIQAEAAALFRAIADGED